jgi:hypothetical protein
MTIEQDIDAALDAGDIERAAILAARLPAPVQYLEAMKRVFDVVKRSPQPARTQTTMTTPQFELAAAKAKLVSYAPRREMHGEDPKPAASLHFVVNLDASDLAMFSPALRASLYARNESAPGRDMVDAVSDGHDLRFPEIGKPITWTKEIIGADLKIGYGLGGRSDISLPTCDVDDFKIDPQQGGQVAVSFRVACHPDEKQSGKLAFMIGDSVELTLTPPESLV